MWPDKMLVYNLSWFVMFVSGIASNRLAGDPNTVLRQRHGVAFKSTQILSFLHFFSEQFLYNLTSS